MNTSPVNSKKMVMKELPYATLNLKWEIAYNPDK